MQAEPFSIELKNEDEEEDADNSLLNITANPLNQTVIEPEERDINNESMRLDTAQLLKNLNEESIDKEEESADFKLTEKQFSDIVRDLQTKHNADKHMFVQE